MALAHGRLTRVYINGYDLTGFFREQALKRSRELAESTVFNLADKTFLAGQRDASQSLEGLYDPATDGIEDVLHTALTTDPIIATVLPQGDTIALPAYGVSGLQKSLDLNTSKDDVGMLATEIQASGGADRMLAHHIFQQENANGQTAAVDGGAATTNGGVGYLHVMNITGITNLAMVIEDSADGSTGWATILTFAGTTASRGRQKVEITGTVRRYTRARWTFTGAGSAQFWTGFGRR